MNDILERLENAIQQGDESTIDALLFISKIEKLKDSKFDYERICLQVINYYKNKYNTIYTENIAFLYKFMDKKIKSFYDKNDVVLKNEELITDKVIERIRMIKASKCSTIYKIRYIKILKNYLKQLNPLMNISEINKTIKRIKQNFYSKVGIVLFLIICPFFLPFIYHLIQGSFIGNIKYPIIDFLTYNAIIYVFTMAIYTALFLFDSIITKGIAKFLIIFTTVGFIFNVSPMVYDLKSPIENFKTETVQFKSVEEHSNMSKFRIGQVDEQKELIFDKSLELETNTKYTITYGKSNIAIKYNK